MGLLSLVDVTKRYPNQKVWPLICLFKGTVSITLSEPPCKDYNGTLDTKFSLEGPNSFGVLSQFCLA